MNVERADAGREVDDAGRRVLLQVRHQGVDAEPQVEVEDQRAVFDEHVGVAGPAVADGGGIRAPGDLEEDSGLAGQARMTKV